MGKYEEDIHSTEKGAARPPLRYTRRRWALSGPVYLPDGLNDMFHIVLGQAMMNRQGEYPLREILGIAEGALAVHRFIHRLLVESTRIMDAGYHVPLGQFLFQRIPVTAEF